MRSLTLLALLLLAGCGSEPSYPAPTNAEAKAAYVRAIRADLIESPPKHIVEGPARIEPGDTPNAAGHKVGNVLLAESERSSRLEARKRIASLAKVTLGACAWGSIDPDDITPHGRDRVEGKVAEGYSCAYEVFHNTETRGPVSARGTGFFFQRDGSYDFAGAGEASFEPVRGR